MYLWRRCVRLPGRSQAGTCSRRSLACSRNWIRWGRGASRTHPHLSIESSFNIFVFMNSPLRTVSRAGQTRADTLTLAAGGSAPGLQAVAGELMSVIAHTHPTIHTRVGGARVSCSLTVDIRVREIPPHNPDDARTQVL